MTNESTQQTPVEFRLLHVGVNCSTPEEARQLSGLYCAMLEKNLSEGETSYFVGSEIEVMKNPFLGAHGHMAYGVSDMAKALQQLEQAGFFPDMETAVYDKDKNLIVVYLKGEFGGFAVHLKRI